MLTLRSRSLAHSHSLTANGFMNTGFTSVKGRVNLSPMKRKDNKGFWLDGNKLWSPDFHGWVFWPARVKAYLWQKQFIYSFDSIEWTAIQWTIWRVLSSAKKSIEWTFFFIFSHIKGDLRGFLVKNETESVILMYKKCQYDNIKSSGVNDNGRSWPVLATGGLEKKRQV